MEQNRVCRHEEEIKGTQMGKKEVKLSLSTDDLILYTDIPKDFTKKLLELVNSTKCRLQN